MSISQSPLEEQPSRAASDLIQVSVASRTNPAQAAFTATTYTISPTLASHPSTLRPAAYLALHPHLTNLLASAAVFHPHTHALLLVQRAPTDFLPLKWELPGGSVDIGTDGSVVAGAVRELGEETGLQAVRAVRWVGEREFGKGWGQGVVEVEVGANREGDLLMRLDPEEHVAYCWVTEGDVREGRCESVVLDYTDEELEVLLLRAFELHGSGHR